MYDIIGDIHGYADELELLLARMGYQCSEGVWQHRERVLVSVGDLIDRGPQQKRTVDIVRRMADNGFAKVVMGNHEFNAIAYATSDEQGTPLRAHTAKNRQQHQVFLQEAEPIPTWYHQTIEWFKSLPVMLDLADLRVVHACWHPASAAVLKNYATADYVLHSDAWLIANQPTQPLFIALETLMKGWELSLPAGYSFADKDGQQRERIRTRWWLGQQGHYQQLALGVPDVATLPDAIAAAELLPGYDNKKPLFIGHYWMTGKPACLSKTIVCTDWSVAAQGALVAYRFDGNNLSDNNFVAVNVRPATHYTVATLAEAFYLADPLHLCCAGNEQRNEYLQLAEHTKTLLNDKLALFEAIKQVLAGTSAADGVTEQQVVMVLAQLATVSD